MYDTFSDEFDSIQAKFFDSDMSYYKTGDRVPMAENGYPRSAIFFMGEHDPLDYKSGLAIVIENEIFREITTLRRALKIYPQFRVFDHDGEEIEEVSHVECPDLQTFRNLRELNEHLKKWIDFLGKTSGTNTCLTCKKEINDAISHILLSDKHKGHDIMYGAGSHEAAIMILRHIFHIEEEKAK